VLEAEGEQIEWGELADGKGGRPPARAAPAALPIANEEAGDAIAAPAPAALPIANEEAGDAVAAPAALPAPPIANEEAGDAVAAGAPALADAPEEGVSGGGGGGLKFEDVKEVEERPRVTFMYQVVTETEEQREDRYRRNRERANFAHNQLMSRCYLDQTPPKKKPKIDVIRRQLGSWPEFCEPNEQH